MNNDILPLDRRNLRGTDSNSLLRLYDQANEILARPALQQERTRAEKAIQRIAKELERRNVPFAPAMLTKQPSPSSDRRPAGV